PLGKIWVGAGLCLPAELVGVLAALLLRHLTVRRPRPSLEALMKWVTPGDLVAGTLAMCVWLIAWPDEVTAGPAVDAVATCFGAAAGVLGGIGLLLVVLLCVFD